MAFPLLIPILTSLLPIVPNILGALSAKSKLAKTAMQIISPLIGKNAEDMDYNQLQYELALVAKNKEIDLKKADLQFRALVMNNDKDLAILDLEIAKLQGLLLKGDASSKDKFRSYWRPAVAWICVSGLFLIGLMVPVTIFVMSLLVFLGLDAGKASVIIGLLSQIDMTIVLSLIIPMLGLGGFRTIEKLKRV